MANWNASPFAAMFLSIEIGVVTILVGLLEATFGPLCTPIAGPMAKVLLGEMFEAAAVNVWQNILRKEEAFQSKKLKLWLPSSPNEPGHFEIPQSHPLCDSHHASTCRGFNLTCAPGFQLSQPILQCLHGHSWNDGYQTACGILGMLQSEVYTYSHESAKCRQTGGEYGYPPPSAFCRICEFHLSTTLTTTWWDYSGPSFRELASEDACIPTTTPSTTTTSNLFGTRDWEIVGNGACRGNHSNDNSASYYRVVQLDSLEDCKAECLATFPSCKGIEYSNGRCEIWTRLSSEV